MTIERGISVVGVPFVTDIEGITCRIEMMIK
jgi:hypothetical protein